MSGFWLIIVALITLIEKIVSSARSDLQTDEFPLSKSLGYSVRKNLGSSSEDLHLSKEYMDHYHEMMKANQESLNVFKDKELEKLGKVVGKGNIELMREGIDRRHSVLRLRSVINQQRFRSKALRREKLNSQSLRSHLAHTKQSIHDDFLN